VRGAIGVVGWMRVAQWLPGWLWGDQQSGGDTGWRAGAHGRGEGTTGGASGRMLGKDARCAGESGGGISGSVGLAGRSWRSRSLFLVATLRDLSRSLFLAATLRDLGSVVTWA